MIGLLIEGILQGVMWGRRRGAGIRRRTEARRLRDPEDLRRLEDEAEICALWSKARGLALSSDGAAFEGEIDGLRVSLDPGCKGSVPRGPTLGVTAAWPSAERLVVNAGTKASHALGALFDTPETAPVLRTVAIGDGSVELWFRAGAQGRAFDRALVELRRLSAEAVRVAPSGHAYR